MPKSADFENEHVSRHSLFWFAFYFSCCYRNARLYIPFISFVVQRWICFRVGNWFFFFNRRFAMHWFCVCIIFAYTPRHIFFYDDWQLNGFFFVLWRHDFNTEGLIFSWVTVFFSMLNHKKKMHFITIWIHFPFKCKVTLWFVAYKISERRFMESDLSCIHKMKKCGLKREKKNWLR